MLDTVHLFPKTHTFNLNRQRKSRNPDVENIAYFRSALLSQNQRARVCTTKVGDHVISDISHKDCLPLSRAWSKARCDRMEGLQM